MGWGEGKKKGEEEKEKPQQGVLADWASQAWARVVKVYWRGSQDQVRRTWSHTMEFRLYIEGSGGQVRGRVVTGE